MPACAGCMQDGIIMSAVPGSYKLLLWPAPLAARAAVVRSQKVYTFLVTSKSQRSTSWLARPCRGPASPFRPAENEK